MTDRRSETSRANLGDHIPEALDPQGTIVVGVRLPRSIVHEIEALAKAHELTRSQAIRDLLEGALIAAANERRENAPATPQDWEALRADKNFDSRIWEHMARVKARYLVAPFIGETED
jgi:hypothetical protein